ncbi:MAG: hypothetical protein ABI905_00910 [Betaproteobacteria bacterium]
MSFPRALALALATLCFALATQVFAADKAATAHDAARKLISDAKCEACHIGKVGGDGSAIYTRKDRRVTEKSKLLPQVERCNSELGLALFPDDEVAIAAYLNATYYKFKD